MTDDTNAADGLGFIKPLEIARSIDGKDKVVRHLVITPLVTREIADAVALSMPMRASMGEIPVDFFKRMRDDTLTPAETGALLTAIVVNGEDFVKLIAALSRQPVEWVGGLLPDRMVRLSADCLLVNVDFFLQAMPLLREAASHLVELVRSAALETSATPTPSSSS